VVVALAVRQALAQLGPRQRAVLILRYFEDLTEARTAEILGVSVGTVKSQARDGLARLRALVPDLSTLTEVDR
jgi:RNA polymerase sigma factor (sigma-70 family)